MSLAVYHPQSSEAQRELEMDPNLPLFRVLIRLAHGIGLPVDAVKKIRNEFLSWYYQTVTLIGTKRLTESPWDGLDGMNWIYKRWSGTHRMVNHNRMYSKAWGPRVKHSTRPSWIELLQSLTGP